MTKKKKMRRAYLKLKAQEGGRVEAIEGGDGEAWPCGCGCGCESDRRFERGRVAA